MHKISIQKQRQILNLTFEGKSIRSIAKKAKVNWRTARKYRTQFNEVIEQETSKVMDQLENDKLLGIVIKKLKG